MFSRGRHSNISGSANRQAVVVFIAMSGRYFSLLAILMAGNAWGTVSVDWTEYRAGSPIKVEQRDAVLSATWNTGGGAAAIAFSLEAGAPLFATMEIGEERLASRID